MLNPRLPEHDGTLDLAKRLLNARAVTDRVLAAPRRSRHRRAASTRVKRALPGLTVKDVRTDQRLLDQTALYLHRRFGDLLGGAAPDPQ